MGLAGIPQPKEGAVTKAHGGMLFVDEIGELHPTELNKLLKVLEDRKVFLDSSYYSSENPNIPSYIKEIFEKRIANRFQVNCKELQELQRKSFLLYVQDVWRFFKSLTDKEISEIAKEAVKKVKLEIEESAIKLIGETCINGREAVNLVQLASGVIINEGRKL